MRAQQNNNTDGAGATGETNKADAQRELLNRTLATYAWNKRFEVGQAEVAEHVGDVLRQGPRTPRAQADRQ
jgi:hypothetical protein